MRLVETENFDIPKRNLKESKVKLAEDIIKHVKPLLHEIYSLKKDDINHHAKQITLKQDQIVKNKVLLQKIIKHLEREKLISTLLNKITVLMNSGFTLEQSVKNDYVIMLKVLPKLDDENIKKHIENVSTLMRKKFYK